MLHCLAEQKNIVGAIKVDLLKRDKTYYVIVPRKYLDSYLIVKHFHLHVACNQSVR